MSEPTPNEEALMDRERLDDLLDASAPAASSLDSRGVRAMMMAAHTAQAAEHVIPQRKHKRIRRTALIGGMLAAFLVGGAGVAVATDGWASLQNPITTYTY